MRTTDLKTTERRRAPAGHAIAVVLLTLVMAAFVNADSLVGSVEQEPFGTSRSVSLAMARPIRTISHWTGLNRPSRWLDELLHGRPQPVVPVAAPRPGAATPPGRVGPSPLSTTTTAAVSGSRRAASPGQPLKVWMAGDSLMGTVSESFGALTGSNPAVNVTTDVQIGTGLARPDVYNWPSAVSGELATVNPDVVVLMFGANDDQDMEIGSHRVVIGTDPWRAEYARRVSQLMALAATGRRQVIWVGIPAVKRPRLNQTKDAINAAVRTMAPQYPGVTFIDANPVFDGPGGSYITFINNAGGQPVKVRESDGIHFTLAGANRLTPLILAPIALAWGLDKP
jgi:uncharacterized protein